MACGLGKAPFFQTELSRLHSLHGAFNAIKEAKNIVYPQLIEFEANTSTTENQLALNGFQTIDNVIGKSACDNIINSFSGPSRDNRTLIDHVYKENILSSILRTIKSKVGTPHLIWSCKFEENRLLRIASDSWHYDNHYTSNIPKMIIYLNSQQE